MDVRLSGRLLLLAILIAGSIAEWKHYSKLRIDESFVYLPRACNKIEEANMGDGRPIWIRLYQGATYMNNEPISRDAIVNVTGTLMDTRAEPVVYLIADGQLSYGEVVPWVSRMLARSPGLAVFLVTHSQEEASGAYHCVILAPPEPKQSRPASN